MNPNFYTLKMESEEPQRPLNEKQLPQAP